MIIFSVNEFWVKDYYPEHYEYRVGIYRDETLLNTGKNCMSKGETVAFIEGLEFAFSTLGEKTKVEFTDEDDDTSTENYYRYFRPDDCEEYLEGNSSKGDREDFHSDG